MGKSNFSDAQIYVQRNARDNTSLTVLYSGVRYIFSVFLFYRLVDIDFNYLNKARLVWTVMRLRYLYGTVLPATHTSIHEWNKPYLLQICFMISSAL